MSDDYAGTWPLLQRSEEVAAVLAGLATPGRAGTLIVGSPGVGKTAIARAAAAQLEDSSHVVLIRGSAAMTATPYGALTVLLMDADPAGSLESLPMLQSLQTALLLRARNRPVILVVDNVQHLDEPSARVLSYLAEVGAARLLVACDGPSAAGARFFDLWRRGRLVRVDVAPLSFGGTRALLEQLLEGPLTATVAVELWRASHGNARYLQAAVRASVASGILTRAPEAWIWHATEDGSHLQARGDTSAALGALPALSEGAEATLDVVAVAGPVPLDALLPLWGAAVVDELEQAGICALDPYPPHAVGVVNTVLGDRVRSALAANPLPVFLEQLNALDVGGLLPAPSRMSLLRWILDAGVPVPGTYLRAAACTANDAGDPVLALRAAAHLTDVDAATLERVRVCLRERRFSEGRAVLKHALEGGPSTDPSDAATEARSLAIEAAVHEGRHGDVLALAKATDEEPLLDEGRDDPLAVERAARIVLARSLTGTGPGAKRSLARLRGTELPVPTGTATRMLQENGFAALVHEGYLEDALLLTGASALVAGRWQDPAVPDALTGAALAAFGQAEAAVAVIVPAVEQLRVDNRSSLLPLAEAARTYAAALLRREDASTDAGVTAPAGSPDTATAEGLPWAYRSAICLLSTLSDSLLADSEVAARRFAVLANGQRAAGNHGVELNLRMHAVRLGQQSQAPLLLDLARRMDTPLAEACELLAQGVAARDPRILLQTAEAAFEIGHLDLAGSAALMSMRLHETDDEPLHFIRAEQIFRRTHVPRKNASARRILTDRERAFARMAAHGASNKEVAAIHHLSVRTVEGHILKAMAKLGISSRKQLATVFT